MVAPRAFISHASEDKDRFVVPFASALRQRGVDAWLDQWEIKAGDSLPTLIFDRGIAAAEAIVVVLSSVSITKPWVREELDAAVVRRVEDKVRLIPVTLDDVPIPASIRSLLRLSVPKLGLSGVVDEIARVLHGGTARPALGPPPSYVGETGQHRFADDPVDDVVLRIVYEAVASCTIDTLLMSNPLQERAAEQGVSADAFFESLHALRAAGRIEGTEFAGGLRWGYLGLASREWLALERARGVDVERLKAELLAHAANEGPRTLTERDDLGCPMRTVVAALAEMQRDGWLTFVKHSNGVAVGVATPLGRRQARSTT